MTAVRVLAADDQRVVREGRRASDVLTRIRGLVQRAPAVA